MIRVAIADDEEYVLKSLKNKILMADDTLVICGCARDGKEAVHILEKNKPDIFFADINMPLIDGLNFIKGVKRKYPDIKTKFIIVSGYDDFHYLQEALRLEVCDYLRKPVIQEELSAVIRKLKLRIIKEREQEKNVLKSNYYFWGDYKEKYKSEQEGTFLIVYGVSVLTIIEQISLKSSLTNAGVLDENMDFEIRMIVFPTIKNAIGIFFNKKQLEQSQIEKISRVLSFKIPIRWIYAYIDGSNMEMAVSVMENYLNKRLVNPNLNIIKCNIHNMIGKYRNEELERALLYGNIKEGKAAASMAIQLLFKDEECILMLNGAYRQIILALINMLLRNGLPVMDGLHSELLSLSLTRYPNQGAVMEQIQGYIQDVISQIEVQKQKNDLAGNVSQYLEEHFKEDPSLIALSEEFFVSPTYLSKRFKEKTGINISEYIEKLKIEHAKTMLLVSNISVTEIAAEVGYMDSNYFSRVFKKTMGMTPRDFRVYYTSQNQEDRTNTN